MEQQDYQLDILVQGYPGKSVCHGGLGGARSCCCAARDMSR